MDGGVVIITLDNADLGKVVLVQINSMENARYSTSRKVYKESNKGHSILNWPVTVETNIPRRSISSMACNPVFREMSESQHITS